MPSITWQKQIRYKKREEEKLNTKKKKKKNQQEKLKIWINIKFHFLNFMKEFKSLKMKLKMDLLIQKPKRETLNKEITCLVPKKKIHGI